jgi:hypothetical protein
MRKRMLAVVLGLLVFSLVAASAASLGVNTASLGAGTEIVASCDDAVDIAFTTGYSGGEYVVTEVVLSDVSDACDGQDVWVQLTADAGTLGSGTAQADDSGTVTVPVGASSAEAVTGVAVVISG